MGMVPDPPNQVFLKIITGKLNSLKSIFVLVLADQRTGHASLDHVLMGEVCNKMDTTYVLAVRGVLMMFQSLFYWYTTSSYSILGEHGKKLKIFSVLQICCHVRTFCVMYGTVKGESLQVKVYFKCIEGIVEGNFPPQITWNLSNEESYFQCSFYFFFCEINVDGQYFGPICRDNRHGFIQGLKSPLFL